MTDEIQVETNDPVCLITLNRPAALNALTYPMLGAFRKAVEAAGRDPRVVGIVVTGTGRGFCSGLDASALQATTTEGSSSRPAPTTDIPGLFTWLLRIPKPIISAVNGVAAGGGFVLAAMSDLRLASTAAQFTSVFSKRGLIAEHGMTWMVPRLIGAGAALDLLWSSRKIDATEAYRVGLVQQVTEPDDLLAAARRYVVDLAENVSPASLADTKRLVYEGFGVTYPDALDEIDRVQYAALDRPDAREGAASLIEKRAPSFPRLGA
ncbi:MAG TPA: enoyl-CoA hydratase-related protein [Acidimicrobiales bacterium]|jgi:enoyl-CoA hydratase/carnithine racemase|nr:enoyl-CoA hydratase-related protein [Acidimicrobiales bacterium]